MIPSNIYSYSNSTETSTPKKCVGPCVVAITKAASAVAWDGATLNLQMRLSEDDDWNTIQSFDTDSTELTKYVNVPQQVRYWLRGSISSAGASTDVALNCS